jgi:hypothetical protein
LSPAERRRSPRIRLQIPMFVRGVDADGSVFLDLTKSFDISSTGAFLASTRALGVETVVQLTIPAPSPVTTAYSRVPPETPPIQARICRQENGGDIHFVGVEFLKALE